MRLGRIAGRLRIGSWALAAMAVGGGFAASRLTAAPDEQTPTFRAGVDLVAVDVQVVDKDGTPIPSLKPGDFDVSIAGKRRRVVSADYLQSANLDNTTVTPYDHRVRVSDTSQPDITPGAGRTFVLAFDTDSFSVDESRDVVAAAHAFIRRLGPDDLVGLYTFPVGPRHEPTVEHTEVAREVETIVGRSQSMIGEYNLSPSEIIDITAESARDVSRGLDRAPTPAGGSNANAASTAAANGTSSATGSTSASDGSQPSNPIIDSVLARVQMRECGALESACADSIRAEANSKAFYLEGRAVEGLNGLRALIQLLGEQPGRKTVVVFSAGIPATDRPGGRPDVGDVAKLLGQDAAATNTTIYTVLLNTRGFQWMASESRKNDAIPTSLSRDNAVASRLLEDFSGASGGALLRVLLGGGDVALSRVLRETSSHYLLGVEPADVDRDGKLRELRVRVARSGATIRARSWVVVPKRKDG
jgi:VWFA-related protein